MANTTITGLPTANTIDGVADWLAIDTASPSSTNKINRNTLLGITSQPVGLTDTQTVKNKIFDNTNLVTLLDGSFTLQNNVDPTKRAVFSAAAITTSTTRTYTLPNVSDTLVSLTATQTLTNKTITAPAITGGTIDNATITVDSIAGHTTSTIVTVANLQISNGVLNSANAVTSLSVAAGAIQPQALVSGTGTGWGLTSYSPAWTASSSNPVVGNGTLTGSWIQIGKNVFFKIGLIIGGTTTFGSGSYRFSLPSTPTAGTSGGLTVIGQGIFVRQGTAYAPVSLVLNGTNVSYAELWYTSSAIVATNVTPTAPYTWANTDVLTIQGWYPVS